MKEPRSTTKAPRRAAVSALLAGQAGWRARLRHPFKKTIQAVTLVLLFHIVLYFQFTAPERRMPALLQRLVAFADAAFVASVVQFVLDDWGARRRRLRLPGGQSVGVATLASAAAFVLIAALWFSNWAPIQPSADDAPLNAPQPHSPK